MELDTTSAHRIDEPSEYVPPAVSDLGSLSDLTFGIQDGGNDSIGALTSV